ncbi:MAG: glycosyltransferase family 39 protein [Nostocales cyanobacterium]|nr:MAG: glycosyltransferase family 39 protein [Nostocales cyanobacterium]TAF11024.1 MAG: glycosyltransferase family 39 protein [Nostocales cyanobacterium]
MQEGSYIWSRLERQHRPVDKWIDRIWLIILLFAAMLLFSINLGGIPLKDWDEGTVAQVAKEIWSAPAGSLSWLYPTLAGEPYQNQPPLMHWLVAWAYAWGGVNEWTTRLPGAIVTAISVPLLYCIARELFRLRWAAIYSALIYLTMLPVVRYGRLAVVDGVVVTLLMVMMLCVLRSRRDLRYCLGIGISFGFICLTKGILGIFIAAIPLVFLFWDTPRILTNSYLWMGVFIGILPTLAWYFAQFVRYSYSNQIELGDQLFHQINTIPHGQPQPLWYYLVEIIKWTWPWLVFLPQTLSFTWENRNLSWAKLVIVWTGVYLLLISLVNVKLPWYLFPIYPSFALAFGFYITQIENLRFFSSYPRTWVTGFAILAVVASAGSIYFSLGSIGYTDLQIICAAVALTMTLAAILAERGDPQFLKILIWGSYVSLFLLIKSNYWTWELGESYAVKPVAAMITRANPKAEKIYTSFPYHRSSLDFYSDRTIIPVSSRDLKYYWLSEDQPYLLVDNSTLDTLNLESLEVIDQAAGWQLITKKYEEMGR